MFCATSESPEIQFLLGLWAVCCWQVCKYLKKRSDKQCCSLFFVFFFLENFGPLKSWPPELISIIFKQQFLFLFQVLYLPLLRHFVWYKLFHYNQQMKSPKVSFQSSFKKWVGIINSNTQFKKKKINIIVYVTKFKELLKKAQSFVTHAVFVINNRAHVPLCR